MAKNDFPKTTPAQKYPLGHAKENKPAEAYDQNGTGISDMDKAVSKSGNGLDKLNISVGGISKSQNNGVKSDGIKVRGTGAATKGTIARGPMA